MKIPYLSVVIPAYNEAKNIKRGVLDDVYKYLRKQQYVWEVLIVDDESVDNTLYLTKEFAQGKQNIKVFSEPHRGKGGTVIAGVLKAMGEIILFTDMDQATPISEVEKLLPKYEEKSVEGSGIYDGVIGSRSGRKGAPFYRKVMAFGFVVLRTLILRLPYKDTQCGFKSFRKRAAREIFGKMRVYNRKSTTTGASLTAGFDLEILYIARKMGYKVAEVPVVWHYEEGTKGKSALRDSWVGLKGMLQVRWNALTGKYR